MQSASALGSCDFEGVLKVDCCKANFGQQQALFKAD
jgi:hypothetical protein